jgi:hypothetical protein
MAAGIISVRQVRKPAHLIFAGIPLLFGIQQFFEGVVWLSLSDTTLTGWHAPAKYAFLFFAQAIWPFWIPLAFLLIEPAPERRRIIGYFLLAGILVSLLLAYRLLFSTAAAHIDGCHIAYDIATPRTLLIVTGGLYIAAIVVAPFFSSWKKAILLASVNVVSLVVTQLFFEVWLVSVWCFFAAVQSVLVILVMREINGRQSKPPLIIDN